MLAVVRDSIDAALMTAGGVCTRAELLQTVTRNQLDDEIKRGHLVGLAPRAYARPWDSESLAHRELAATKSAGPIAALSHLSALRRHRLPVPLIDAIHISTPVDQFIRPRVGLIVHRTAVPIIANSVTGVRSVVPANAIVESWSLLRDSEQRAPAIGAVADRRCTVDQLRVALKRHQRVAGRADLAHLIGLLDAGCRSELELWGYSHVFNVPTMRPDIRQRAIVVRGRTYYLDMAYERQRLCVELDGRAYHSSATQWERDIARDLALATMGWQTIRFSHRRLTTDVDGCRRDLRNVLAQRERPPP